MNKKIGGFFLFFLVLAGIVPNAFAQRATHPISDAGSYVQPLVKMEWDDIVPVPGQQSMMISGSFHVQLKLDTRAFEGKQGRIFIVLQPTSFGEVFAKFQPEGALVNGEVRTTQRGLIYSGVMPYRFDEKVFFTITTNGKQVVRPEDIEFRFEAEFM